VHQDLPPHVWQFIKDKGFLGMIIPKNHGGKEFSAYMHSQVVQKLASRCSAWPRWRCWAGFSSSGRFAGR